MQKIYIYDHDAYEFDEFRRVMMRSIPGLFDQTVDAAGDQNWPEMTLFVIKLFTWLATADECRE